MKTRISASEAGRRGGLIGGRSKSPAKLAACRRNGFQKIYNVTAAEIMSQLKPTAPRLLVSLGAIDANAQKN